MKSRLLLVVLVTFICLALVNPAFAKGTLKGKRVFLDPGHGGIQGSGAVGPKMKTKESDINYWVTERLKKLLEAEGVIVGMSRDFENSSKTKLHGITDKSKKFKPDLHISLHHNATAHGDNEVDRSEAYFSWYHRKGPSEDMSRLVRREMEVAFNLPRSRTYLTFAYWVLRRNNPPAILAEPRYLSNPNAEEDLLKPEVLQAEAEAYFRAVKQFFENGVPTLEPSFKGDLINKIKVIDDVAEVDPALIIVLLNDENCEFEFDPALNSITIIYPEKIKPGTNSIEVGAKNINGISAERIRHSFNVIFEPQRYFIEIPFGFILGRGLITPVYVECWDKNGSPPPDGTLVEWNCENSKTKSGTTSTKDGRVTLHFQIEKGGKLQLNLKFVESGLTTNFAESISLENEINFNQGIVKCAITGEPIPGAYVNGIETDGVGFYCYEISQNKVVNLNAKADGYFPLEIIGKGKVDFELTPLFGGLLQDKPMVLDPAAGGENFGYVGQNKLRESEVNLRVAEFLEDYLKRAGAKTWMTRRRDKTMDDEDRVYFGLNHDADFFLSIRHIGPRKFFNESDDLNLTRGFHKWSDSSYLPEKTVNILSDMIGTPAYDVKRTSTWESMHASKEFFGWAICPLFMTAPGADEKLDRIAFNRKEALGIFYGIVRGYAHVEAIENYDETVGSVKGKILDEKGKPLANAMVWLNNTLPFQTDVDGVYDFRLLSPGEYILTVYVKGFESEKIKTTIQANKKEEIDIPLKQN